MQKFGLPCSVIYNANYNKRTRGDRRPQPGPEKMIAETIGFQLECLSNVYYHHFALERWQ